MKRIIAFLVTCVLCVIVIALLAKYKGVFAPTTLPVIAQKQISQKNTQLNYSVSIYYPQITIVSDVKATQDMQNGINKILSNAQKSFIASEKSAVSFPVPAYFSGSLTIRYAIERSDNKIVSVLFTIENFPPGAAHPTTTLAPFSYGITQHQQITLANLFNQQSDYLSFLSATTAQALKDRFISQGNDFTSFVVDGTSPKQENFQKFVLEKDSLLVTFDQYAVAPGSAGIQTVAIPYDKLSGYLSPAYQDLVQ